MDKFQDKTIFTCNFALTEQSGGTGADIHTTAVKDENGDYILNGEKWLIIHTDCCRVTPTSSPSPTSPKSTGDDAPVRLLRARRHPRLRGHPDAPHDGLLAALPTPA